MNFNFTNPIANVTQAHHDIRLKHGDDVYRALLKLFGSEAIQKSTLEQGMFLADLFQTPIDPDGWAECFIQLQLINKRSATRMLMALPLVLCSHGPVDFTEEEFWFEKEYWMTISLWLLRWQMDLPGGHAITQVLNHLYPRYRARARLSQLRYDMIQGMIDLQSLNFPRAAFP
jgi:hypothetical protein